MNVRSQASECATKIDMCAKQLTRGDVLLVHFHTCICVYYRLYFSNSLSNELFHSLHCSVIDSFMHTFVTADRKHSSQAPGNYFPASS